MDLISEILSEQQRYLKHFFDSVDQRALQHAIDVCLATQGIIVFTGVGKSGIIAEKIAMTLVSTGTKALYLPPTNFLHGDIGILTEQDLLVMLTRSGETEELLSLVPFVRQRNARLMAVVSNAQARLAALADIAVHLPVEKELCPFDLAPTTSTTVQLLFGDLLAVALMRLKGFNLQSYALNHPAGSIGKKIMTTVSQLMFKGDQVPLCGEDARLLDVLVDFSNKKCGAVLVVNESEELQGIFTDGDLRRALQAQGSSVLELPMKALMTRSPLAITQDLLAWDAMKLMQKDPKKYVMVLPVVDNNKVVGILRMHDLVQAGIA